MKSSIVFLPALVAICNGAAIPQELGDPGLSFNSPEPTAGPALTFVVPCIANLEGCTPRTLTLYGRDAEAMPRSLLAREPEPQILWTGEVSRTNIIIPSNPTKTHHHHSSSTSTTSDCDPEPTTYNKRQVLGDPSRTEILTPSSPSVSVTTATVVATVTTTVDDCEPSSSAKPWTPIKPTDNPSLGVPSRTTYADNGVTLDFNPDDKSPLTAREVGIISTVTQWVTATQSSSTEDSDDYSTTTTTVRRSSSTRKPTTKSSSRRTTRRTTTSDCDDEYEDCYPTATSKTLYTISTGDFATTITLPGITFGKRDQQWKTKSSSSSDDEDCETTTSTKKHTPKPTSKHTTKKPSHTDSVIRATVTLPTLTLGTPPAFPDPEDWKREANWKPSTTSDEDCETTTSTKKHHHTSKKPSYTDSVIRATVTLPTLTLGTPPAFLDPEDWKRAAEAEWKPSTSSDEDCETTTSTKKHHHTSKKPSPTDSVIRATVTLPTLTLGTPPTFPDDWKREAGQEWHPSKSSSTEDCETTTSSSKYHHHTSKKPSPSDSVIRATVTLPTLTLGTPPAFPDPEDWKRDVLKTFTPPGFKPTTTSTSYWDEPTDDPSTSTDEDWDDYSTTSSTRRRPTKTSTRRVTSTGDGVIRQTVTLGGITVGNIITLGGPGGWKREEQKTKSKSTKRATTMKTSTKPRYTHKPTTVSVIRQTATLPELTLKARQFEPTLGPVATATPDLSGFPGWSWYWPFPKPATATDSPTVTLELPPRQELGFPSRTEILTPSATGWWPAPTTSTVVVTYTDTYTTQYPTTTTDEDEDSGTTTCWPTTSAYSSVDVIRSTVLLPPITLAKRDPQILITATRTEILPTQSVTSISAPYPTWGGWPWWPAPVTVTITSIIRETVTLPAITLGAAPAPWRKGKRNAQGMFVPSLGSLTRTMLVGGSTVTPALVLPTPTMVTSVFKPAL